MSILINIIQSKTDKSDQDIIPLPRKQTIRLSIPLNIIVMIIKKENFILVIPATIHMASSGNIGIEKTIGSNSLLLLSTKSCACSNSFFPMSLMAKFSPNLSPRKNSRVDEMIEANQEIKKAVFAPKSKQPNNTRAVLSTGTKQNKMNNNISINRNVKIPYC